MDKKELRKLCAGLIILFLIIVITAVAAVWIVQSNIPEIQFSNGSAAYKDFVQALTNPNFNIGSDTHLLFILVSTIGMYIGAVLFVVSLIMVFAKRSMRFVFLPIAGLCAVVAAAYLYLAGYQVVYVVTGQPEAIKTTALVLPEVVLTLGVAALILGIVFPRRLVRKDTDEEPVAAAEKAPAEEAEEPESEPEPEPEPAEAAPTPVIAEEPKEEEPEPEQEPELEPEPKEEVSEEPEPEKKKAAPGKKAAAKKESKPEPQPEPEPAVEPAPATEDKPKVVGKYEVYPEAGYFKFRLKANNGEILVVSNPYKTKESALAGIETLKKNMPLGNAKIVVDKNGYGQFRIFTGNDTRLVVAGEIYPTAARAEKALASTMKFYDAERVNVLDEIPEAEHREWHAFPDEVQPSANGKITIAANEEGKLVGTLTANNGEVLFVTSTYSAKPAIRKALDNIRGKLLAGDTLTIAKDKQDRYQFRIYSDNGMLLLMGETYSSRDSAEKALRSARNFIGDAKIVEE